MIAVIEHIILVVWGFSQFPKENGFAMNANFVQAVRRFYYIMILIGKYYIF